MSVALLKSDKPLHIPSGFDGLPDSWTFARIDNLTEGIFDCPHSTPKLTERGPFVVRTQDIITGIFRTDQAGRVSEETYAERVARVTPQHGDLLYSREGTYFGIAAEVPENTKVCLGQRMVLIRPRSQQLDFRYLRYWLNSPMMSAYVHGFKDGSVAERLNLPTIRALPILLPPLPEQKRIAHILGTLDDKIELNRKMNETLEAMAQALFKSWFIDFDPVIDNAIRAGNPIPEEFEERAARRRALMNQNQPSPPTPLPGGEGSDSLSDSRLPNEFPPLPLGESRGEGVPWHLFPSRFQHTEELGWIPEGWEMKPFSSIARLDTTSVKPFEEPETLWEHYSIPSYDSSGMPSMDRGDQIKSNKYKVKPGAILSSKLNPETERTWWPFMMNEKASVCSTEFMQFVPIIKEDQAFVYSLIRSHPFQGKILERVTGSTGSRQRAQPKQIAEIEVLDCGGTLRSEFIGLTLPLFRATCNNSLEINTLIKVRDNLLNRIMSRRD
jgi:hypothetical protein